MIGNDNKSVKIMLHTVRNARIAAESPLEGSYREVSLAKTKLEEAEMWLQRLLERGY